MPDISHFTNLAKAAIRSKNAIILEAVHSQLSQVLLGIDPADNDDAFFEVYEAWEYVGEHMYRMCG